MERLVKNRLESIIAKAVTLGPIRLGVVYHESSNKIQFPSLPTVTRSIMSESKSEQILFSTTVTYGIKIQRLSANFAKQ